MRAIQPCALLREPVGTGTRSGNGKPKTALGRRVGARTRRERWRESSREHRECGRRERSENREAAKLKRGRGRELPRTRQLRWCGSALLRPTAKAGPDCVGRVRVRVSRVPPLILTKARSPRCAKRNRPRATEIGDFLVGLGPGGNSQCARFIRYRGLSMLQGGV